MRSLSLPETSGYSYGILMGFVVSVSLLVPRVGEANDDLFLVYHPLSLDYQIVSTHRAETQGVLRESLARFFDGPSDVARTLGAMKPFECIGYKEIETWPFDYSAFYDCNAADLLGSIRIEEGVAFIELKGLPNAPSSGGWEGFLDSFSLTVLQFKTVNDFVFVYRGYEVSGGDGSPCSHVCFVMLDESEAITEEVLNSWSNYGWRTLD